MQLGEFINIIEDGSRYIPIKVISELDEPEAPEKGTILFEGAMSELTYDVPVIFGEEPNEVFLDELYVDTIDVGADADIDGFTIYVC